MTIRARSVGRAACAAVALTAALVTTAAAQPPAAGQAPGRGGPPPAPQNLQILPKDMPREELIATMRAYAAGLGVMCNYCHVQEGRGGRNDMASDEKAPKKTARVMMQMTARVNEALAANLGKPAADVTKVQCMTCHRGEAIPKLPPPAAPTATPPAPGH